MAAGKQVQWETVINQQINYRKTAAYSTVLHNVKIMLTTKQAQQHDLIHKRLQKKVRVIPRGLKPRQSL